MKEKKALDREWAVNWQRAIKVNFIDRRSGCVNDFPDFAAIFSIFINLISMSGNIHNTFSLLHEIWIEIRKTFRK